MAALAPPPPPEDDAPPLPSAPPPVAPHEIDATCAQQSVPAYQYPPYYGQAPPVTSGQPTHAPYVSYTSPPTYYAQYAAPQHTPYPTVSAPWGAYGPAQGDPASYRPYYGSSYGPGYGAPAQHTQPVPHPYLSSAPAVSSGAHVEGLPPAMAPPPAPAPLPAPGGVCFSLPARVTAPGAVQMSGPSADRARRHFNDGPQLAASAKLCAGAEAQGRQRLSDWVQRAFARYPGRIDELREKIKLILKPFVDSASQWQHDWDREPIPDLGSSDGSVASHLDDLDARARAMSPPHGRMRCRASLHDSPHEHANKRPAPPMRIQPQSNKKSKKAAKAAAQQNKAVSAPSRALSAAQAARVDARAARFHTTRRPAGTALPSDDDDDDEWQPNVIVQGRCTDLEKEFLRLNGPPDPAKVRPELVIQQALDRIVGMIARGEREYRYHWSQLKAMRQDLIVQHVQNETAAAVEEAFARRALEHGDMRNYQKCSTALRVLYDTGVQGCRAEFDAYRILANICQDHCTSDELLKSIKEATTHGVGSSAEVRHALRVHTALTMGNARGFWKLYAEAPHCGRLIMDRAAPAVRLAATKALVSRFKPAAGQAFCLTLLGFDLPPRRHSGSNALQPGCCQEQRSLETQDAGLPERVQQCRECLQAFKAVIAVGQGGELELRAKDNKVDAIVMPDEKDMKGHGHAEVSLTDFQKVVV